MSRFEQRLRARLSDEEFRSGYTEAEREILEVAVQRAKALSAPATRVDVTVAPSMFISEAGTEGAVKGVNNDFTFAVLPEYSLTAEPLTHA